jgi:RNA polymerase sigma factor (sigma-70 family)
MGDKRARFEAQVLPHLDAAYRFARWLSRSPTDADDLVQDAFLRAFRGFDGLRGADAKPWLLTIVRNCHSTAAGRQQRSVFVPLPEESSPSFEELMIDSAPGPESATVRQDEQRALHKMLAGLAEEHREVLVLREIEELDYRQISAVINAPIGTVMSRLARARASLKSKWLQENEKEPHAMR